jgi:hypothetical protein
MFLNGNKVCEQVSSTWLGGQAVSMHANTSTNARYLKQCIRKVGVPTHQHPYLHTPRQTVRAGRVIGIKPRMTLLTNWLCHMEVGRTLVLSPSTYKLRLSHTEQAWSWPVYSLALAYQVTSAVWRLAGRLPSRLLQNTEHSYGSLQNEDNRIHRQVTPQTGYREFQHL